jgi:excisionase family DNA binding protein
VKGKVIVRRKADPQKPAILARPTEVKKLLKVTEVAEVLGVSKVKVYELLKSGLPSVKFDGARRVHPDKLRDWIEQHSAYVQSHYFRGICSLLVSRFNPAEVA